jgi:hypothetical protein
MRSNAGAKPPKSTGDGPRDSGKQLPATKSNSAEDPLIEAVNALKELRQHLNNKQAADRLERALQQLKEQTKPKNSLKSH